MTFLEDMTTIQMIAVIALIGLAIFLCFAALIGVACQLSAAANAGFIGVVAFFAAWVCLFPVMLIWAIIEGIVYIFRDG